MHKVLEDLVYLHLVEVVAVDIQEEVVVAELVDILEEEEVLVLAEVVIQAQVAELVEEVIQAAVVDLVEEEAVMAVVEPEEEQAAMAVVATMDWVDLVELVVPADLSVHLLPADHKHLNNHSNHQVLQLKLYPSRMKTMEMELTSSATKLLMASKPRNKERLKIKEVTTKFHLLWALIHTRLLMVN